MPLRFDLSALLFCSGLLGACAASHDADLPSFEQSPGRVHETARALSPLRAELIGPPQPKSGELLRLRLHVSAPRTQSARLALAWKLPPGARQVDELPLPESLWLTADSPSAEHDLELVLDEIPREDLIVSLHAWGGRSGYHAQLRYRFGRGPAASAAPSPGAAEVVVAGRRYGPSIELK